MRAAARIVWSLGVRHLLSYRLRLSLSALGVASGVALAIAVSSLGSSIEASLKQVAESTASGANLEVRPPGGGMLAPDTADVVRSVPGIRAAGSVVEALTTVRAGGRSANALAVGLDPDVAELQPGGPDVAERAAERIFAEAEAMLDEPFGPEAMLAPERTPPDPFGLAMSRSLARELDVGEGDRVQIASSTGWRTISISSVGTDGSASTIAGSIDVVRDALGRPDGADVVYARSDDPRSVLPAVQRAIGPRGVAGPPALRSGQIRRLLGSATVLLALAGVATLFVGGFLVYNTMSMAAVERAGEAAIMRAVGATRRQVFSLHCAEGALLGAIGSVAGVAGGVALSGQILGSRGSTIREVYPVDITRLSLRPRDLAVAWAIGVVAALAASFLPARRVARADPAPLLGPAGSLEDPVERSHRVALALGLALFTAGVAAILYVLSVHKLEQTTWGLTACLAGVALLIRPGIPAAARFLLGPLASESSRAAGVVRLAAGETLRSPGRTAFTVGAVMLALALAIGINLGTQSFSRTFNSTFEDLLRADLYVRSQTWRPIGSGVPLDASVADQIRAVPGVHSVYPFRTATGTLDGRPVLMITWDFKTFSELPGMRGFWKREARREYLALREPGSVLVSSSVPIQLGYRVGDHVEIPTPSGAARLKITGTVPDPSAINPALFLEFAEFRRLFGSNAADVFPTSVERGASVEVVKSAIEQRLPGLGLRVDTRRQYVDRVSGLMGAFLGLVSSLLVVVVLTAGLGLANTLILSTLERRRDLGVLRSVGMRRSEVRRMVAAEALIVGALGTLFALAIGTALGYLFTTGSEGQLGVPVSFRPAPMAYLQGIALGTIGAVVASAWPAWRAARLDVVDALRYE